VTVEASTLGFFGAPIISKIDDFEEWENQNESLFSKLNVCFKGIGTDWQNMVIFVQESFIEIGQDSNERLRPLPVESETPNWKKRLQAFAMSSGLEIGECRWYVSLNES
jgi:hypothetical protein